MLVCVYIYKFTVKWHDLVANRERKQGPGPNGTCVFFKYQEILHFCDKIGVQYFEKTFAKIIVTENIFAVFITFQKHFSRKETTNFFAKTFTIILNEPPAILSDSPFKIHFSRSSSITEDCIFYIIFNFCLLYSVGENLSLSLDEPA